MVHWMDVATQRDLRAERLMRVEGPERHGRLERPKTGRSG
jgi:hypothetical protein